CRNGTRLDRRSRAPTAPNQAPVTGATLMPSSPADWQLPPGVSRGLWDYLHDATLARTYDDSLADCALLAVDRLFVERHCARAGRLIDLGCGTGRLLLPFARHGYWVLGVDLSAE